MAQASNPPPHPGRENGTSEAERVVRDMTARWDHRHGDLARLLDGACARLADTAGHELRQILAQLSAELELLSRARGAPPVDERVDRMLGAVHRASHLIETHLDRNEIAQLMITLDPRPVDLATVLRSHLDRVGLTPEQARIDLPTTLVDGDPTKLSAALGHLVDRFARQADPDQVLHVQVGEDGDAIEGVVGLVPNDERGEALIEALEQPLDIEEAGVDLPYARAVVERHDGTLSVQRIGQTGLGLGFRLPRTHSEEVHP